MSGKFANLKHEEEQIDLDLAPMLSVIISLIPILLLTAVYMEVGVLETQLPQVISAAVEQERKDEKPPVTVKADISRDAGINIEISANGQVQRKQIPMINSEFDFDKFHKELVSFKEQFPMTFRLELRPTSDVPYDKIIKIMDAARKTKKGDKQIFVIDQKTNQKMPSDVLFVDIFFGNVMEG